MNEARPARPPSERRQFVRNAGSAYGLRFVLGLSALLLTPYLFRRLGVAGFGTWSVIFTISTVFSLLELGFGGGAVKLVAELRAKRQWRALDEAIGAAVVLQAVLGLVSVGIAVAVAFLASGLAPPEYQHDFQVGMLVVGAVAIIRFPLSAYSSALAGYQRYDLLNTVRGVAAAAFPLLAVAAVETGHGVLGVVIAYAASLLVDSLVYALLLRRVDQNLALRPRLGGGPARRRLRSFSSFVLMIEGMRFIAQRMDTVVIAAVRDAAAAGPYAAAVKLQTAVQSVSLPIVNLLTPMMSDLWARGRRDEALRRLTLATRAVTQLTLPVAAAVAIFAGDTVQVWLGPEAPRSAAWIIVALMAVQVVTLAAAPAEQFLVGVGRVRGLAGLSAVEGVSNIGLSVSLVSLFGAVGAALASLFTSALLSPIRFPMVCRAMGSSVHSFLLKSIGPSLLSSLPALACAVVVRLTLPQGPLRLFVGLSLTVAAATAVGVRQVGVARLRGFAQALVPAAPGHSGGRPAEEPRLVENDRDFIPKARTG
jgi:O-antigen/teichoic acid export membrane protein